MWLLKFERSTTAVTVTPLRTSLLACTDAIERAGRCEWLDLPPVAPPEPPTSSLPSDLDLFLPSFACCSSVLYRAASCQRYTPLPTDFSPRARVSLELLATRAFFVPNKLIEPASAFASNGQNIKRLQLANNLADESHAIRTPGQTRPAVNRLCCPALPAFVS